MTNTGFVRLWFGLYFFFKLLFALVPPTNLFLKENHISCTLAFSGTTDHAARSDQMIDFIKRL